MATTRGQGEPEPTKQERVTATVANALAGQGIVRRVALYIVMFGAMGVAYWFAPVIVVALVAGVMLLATDTSLS